MLLPFKGDFAFESKEVSLLVGKYCPDGSDIQVT